MAQQKQIHSQNPSYTLTSTPHSGFRSSKTRACSKEWAWNAWLARATTSSIFKFILNFSSNAPLWGALVSITGLVLYTSLYPPVSNSVYTVGIAQPAVHSRLSFRPPVENVHSTPSNNPPLVYLRILTVCAAWTRLRLLMKEDSSLWSLLATASCWWRRRGRHVAPPTYTTRTGQALISP